MLGTVTVDIMLPFWGEPELLFATVASVRAQTDPGWRLTVLDDGYPDARVAEHFRSIDDARIQYVRRERNAGIVENFRASVSRATAEYLTVLGSDDLLHPDYVSHIHATVERHPGVDVIQPGVIVIDALGRRHTPLVDRVKHALAPRTARGDVTMHGEHLATSLVRGDWLYWPSLAFKTASIQAHDFRDDLPIILDLAILLDLVFEGATLVATADEVFSYRRHRASASQTSLLDGRRFEDERRFYQEVAERAGAARWHSTERAARRRVLSRLHALAELPHVVRHGTAAGRAAALRHIFR